MDFLFNKTEFNSIVFFGIVPVSVWSYTLLLFTNKIYVIGESGNGLIAVRYRSFSSGLIVFFLVALILKVAIAN